MRPQLPWIPIKDLDNEKIIAEIADNLNKMLNKAWEEKEDKSKNELEYEGVTFFRRKLGDRQIWATDKENFLAVANILGEINEC
ncbi:MAG: hypothetical protein ABIE84_02305 [bacterium]